MSKLVVKIRDDDRNFPHCPLHHEGYCHLPQTHYYKGNALYMIECLGTINQRPPWCPLKEEKEAIPIEWMQQMIEEDKTSGHIDEYGEYQEGTTLGESCEHVLVNWYNTYKWKWEKENETN